MDPTVIEDDQEVVLDVYRVRTSRSILGVILFGCAFVVGTPLFAVSSFLRGAHGEATMLGVLSLAFLIAFVALARNLAKDVEYAISNVHLIERSRSGVKKHLFSEVRSVKKSWWAGENGRAASYKVVLENGQVIWFNRADSQADRFVVKLADLCGLDIK